MCRSIDVELDEKRVSFSHVLGLLLLVIALCVQGNDSFPGKNQWIQRSSCGYITCGLAREGELWLGSSGCGVIVLDSDSGVVLRRYNTSNSLFPSNNVTSIVEGPDDDVWIGTGEGIVVLSDTGVEVRHLSDITRRTASWSRGFLLARSPNGAMWVGIRGVGIFRYDGKEWQDVLDTYPGFPTRLLHYPASSIVFDSTGTVWIGLSSPSGGPDLLSLRKGRWGQHEIGPVRNLAVDSQNRIWAVAGTREHMWCITDGTPQKQSSIDTLFNRSFLRAPVINNDGEVFACAQNAIWKLRDSLWIGYHHPHATWGGKTCCAVSFKAYDGPGIWMRDDGHNTGSSFIWQFVEGQWNKLPLPACTWFLKSGSSITGLACASDGSVWAQSGPVVVDVEPNLHIKATRSFGRQYMFAGPGETVWYSDSVGLWSASGMGVIAVPRSMFGMQRQLSTAVFDSAGGIWVGTYEERTYAKKNSAAKLLHFDRTDWRVVDVDTLGVEGHMQTYPLTVLPNGEIWVKVWIPGRRQYDALMHQGKGAIGIFRSVEGKQWTRCPVDDATSVVCGADGSVFVGTWGHGLHRYRDGLWSYFDTTNTNIPGMIQIPHTVDKRGRVWSAVFRVTDMKWFNEPYCEPAGFACFDGKQWYAFDMQNSGIQSNMVLSLAFDDQGRLWVGTPNGLARWKGSYPQ